MPHLYNTALLIGAALSTIAALLHIWVIAAGPRGARLAELARQRDWPLTLRIQPGYDHSYFTIATFVEDHLRFHAEHLFR